MIILAGPFIGEFGWELSYWHAWLRYLKHNHFQDFKMIVSSYPEREPLYEFADEFIPISNSFISKNYSQRAFFLDFNKSNISILKKDLDNLYTDLRKKVAYENYMHITCFPQKIKTTNFFYRVIKLIKVFNDKKEPFYYQNKCAGKIIKNPFHLNFPYKEKKYYPQYPDKKYRMFKELKNSNKAENETNKIIKSYQKKHIFTLFPRKREVRRSDKNWGEKNWKLFIDMLIKKYDPLIIICGTNDGSYFTDLDNNKNIYNSIKKKELIGLLDFQISLIRKSHISIHSLSGSAILSLMCKKDTFMYGDTRAYKEICIEGNPLNTNLKYYTDEGLNPKPINFFNQFEKFYEKIRLRNN